MRGTCLLLASVVAMASVPAMAGNLLVSRGAVAVDEGPVSVIGRDGRVRVEAQADGSRLDVQLVIDSVAAQRQLTAGARLAEGQRFAVRMPSSDNLVGETVVIMRDGDEVRVVVTRPTAVDAMRDAPAALIASAQPALDPAVGATPR